MRGRYFCPPEGGLTWSAGYRSKLWSWDSDPSAMGSEDPQPNYCTCDSTGGGKGSKTLLPGTSTCEGEAGSGPGRTLLVRKPQDTSLSLPVVEGMLQDTQVGAHELPTTTPWGKQGWSGFPNRGAP